MGSGEGRKAESGTKFYGQCFANNPCLTTFILTLFQPFSCIRWKGNKKQLSSIPNILKM